MLHSYYLDVFSREIVASICYLFRLYIEVNLNNDFI